MRKNHILRVFGQVLSFVRGYSIHRGVLCALLAALIFANCGIVTAHAESAPGRNQTVVISDIHLGANAAFAEIRENKPVLTKFLTQLKDSKDTAELVIAGDLMDQWFLPMDYEMPESLSIFNDEIVKNNQEIVDAINLIIKEGNIRVTYVPGNHDILFNEAEAARIFPGINQARDAAGVGTYRASNIAVEHGHRYNIACAPDPFSNTEITGGGSILPYGYFFTRIATSSILEGKPKSPNTISEISPDGLDAVQMDYYKYYMSWKGYLSSLPVKESFSDKVIKTGVDGYAQPFSISDIIPSQGEDGKLTVNLFSGLIENWPERQSINHVPSPISAGDAVVKAATAEFTDAQAQTQYFDRDASVRVVIFGHSHIATVTTSKNLEGDDVIYANSGTWIDHQPDAPSCTYVVVTPSQDGSQTAVALYQFDANGSSALLKEAQIDN